MSAVPVLRGLRLVLRPARPSDSQDRLRSGRSAEYVTLCGGDARHLAPFTCQEAHAWYERIAQEPHGWCIDVQGQCIGHARLHSLDQENRRARYAIGLFDTSVWGQGYGTEATRLVMRYGFETLGLHRIDLRVLDYNERAIACYERCGFVREGIERESALIAGQWHSDLFMSILEQEYAIHRKLWWPHSDA